MMSSSAEMGGNCNGKGVKKGFLQARQASSSQGAEGEAFQEKPAHLFYLVAASLTGLVRGW